VAEAVLEGGDSFEEMLLELLLGLDEHLLRGVLGLVSEAGDHH